MTLMRKSTVKPPGWGSDSVPQADTLVQRAQTTKYEQSALLEASTVESRYDAALKIEVEGKYDQAMRIEERIENLIELKASRLQQTPQVNPPGLIALPGTRARWRNRVKLQSDLQRLHDRLDAVREIREGMGLHGPRIEELAARKLRAAQPALAKEWEEMCQARRLHQALQRGREKEQDQEREGRALRLDLTPRE